MCLFRRIQRNSYFSSKFSDFRKKRTTFLTEYRIFLKLFPPIVREQTVREGVRDVRERNVREHCSS